MSSDMSSGVQNPAAVESPWRRLDARMLVISPVNGLIRMLPVVVILLVTGQGDVMRLWIAGAVGVLVVLASVLTWRTTRYRITPERVELHSGWLNRQRRSVPRDRIRTVDLTSRLLHRAFGLSVVEVSAGAGASAEHSGLNLDAVSKVEAELLRRELLDRSHIAAATDGATHGAQPAHQVPPPIQELARLRWSWLRLAPLTFSSLAGMAALAGAAFNLLDNLGIDPRDIGPVDAATDRLTSEPIWLSVLLIIAVLLVLAAVGSLVLFAERWFGYRLTREPGTDGSSALRVKRGLLTRRSLSVAEDRLRGAEIVEPLLLRAGRGAQCRAISTGLSKDSQGGALQPPVPRDEAHRVASAALREDPAQITRSALRRHPRAALIRRLTRAIGSTAVVVVAAFTLGWLVPVLDWIGPTSLVLLPVAVLIGLDRYRNLGHQLTARYLVTRHGSLQRRTVALQRQGVIGWTFRQSIFQRRSGLITLEAVTAAGQGGYQVLDLATADAAALAAATTPQLLPVGQ
jgi:putative membrane protein